MIPGPAALSIAEARREIDAGRLSPVELTEAVLAAVESENEELRAYLHVDREAALATARHAERALREGLAGPLAGIPICVKDVIDVAGMPTTAGAAGWSRSTTDDAPAVARLRETGAVIVGKGNTNEFAFGIDGRNPHRGDCRNPLDRTRISGGSSAGPACSTAAGLALAGVGTDTSGSLRVPASLCGLVSLRPTHGLVPTAGVVPLAWSYDVVGPITRTVEDAALVFGVLAGADGALPEAPLRGRRVGIVTAFLERGCPGWLAEAVRAAAATLEADGAEIQEVELPLQEHVVAIHQAIQFAEAASAHSGWVGEQRERYEPGVRDRLEAGALLTAADYLNAQRARALLMEETARVTEGLDALLAPATPVVAPPLDAETVEVAGEQVPQRVALLSFTVPLNQLGTPVVVVPLGEHEGLPFGMQIMGRVGRDRELLGLAASYRRAAGQPEPVSAGENE